MNFWKLILTFFNPARTVVFDKFNIVDNYYSRFDSMNTTHFTAKPKSIINGKISCANTQINLENVVVVVEELSLITVSNANGEFSLDFSTRLYLPEQINITFSNKSHQEFACQVDIQQANFLDIKMLPEAKPEKKSHFNLLFQRVFLNIFG